MPDLLHSVSSNTASTRSSRHLPDEPQKFPPSNAQYRLSPRLFDFAILIGHEPTSPLSEAFADILAWEFPCYQANDVAPGTPRLRAVP